jgi:hypothetical protein
LVLLDAGAFLVLLTADALSVSWLPRTILRGGVSSPDLELLDGGVDNSDDPEEEDGGRGILKNSSERVWYYDFVIGVLFWNVMSWTQMMALGKHK